MKFGIWLPFSHAQWVTQMARLAEQSGWDGVFLRERVVGLDRWIPVAAAALSTQKILIGGVISPDSVDALRAILREAYHIHRRSGQRLVVCLGKWFRDDILSPSKTALTQASADLLGAGTNDVEDPAWLRHHLAVWCIGVWPDRESILGTIVYQGVIPVIGQSDGSWRAPTPLEIEQLAKFLQPSVQPDEPFEIVVEITLEDYEPKELLEESKAWEVSGATWSIVNYDMNLQGASGMTQLQKIIELGPPG